MSTKIFNGYKIPLMPMPDLMEFLYKFRDKVQVEAEKLYFTRIAEIAAMIVDKRQLEPEKANAWLKKQIDYVNGCAAFCAQLVVDKARREIKRTMQRDPLNDFSCDLCLVPTKDKILVLLYTEQESMRKIWENMSGVEAYPYWNNVDKPDELSDEEWDARGDEWDNALGKLGIPARAGLTFEPIDEYIGVSKPDEFMQYVPSVEERAYDFAYDRAFTEWLKENNKGIDENNFVSLVFKFNDWAKGEGAEKWAQAKKDMVSQLKPKLTKEDFTKDWKE